MVNSYLLDGDGISTKDMEDRWIKNLVADFSTKKTFNNCEELSAWMKQMEKMYSMQVKKKIWNDENG
jgi:hypothetical protein